LAATTSIAGARLLSSSCGLGVGFVEKARHRRHGGGIKRRITFSENSAPRRAGSRAWVQVREDCTRECRFGEGAHSPAMAIDKPGISPTLFWPAQYEAIGDPVSVKIAIFTFYDSLAESGEDALTLLVVNSTAYPGFIK
jgi:hypothetical protein